jgi:hypothetical protein
VFFHFFFHLDEDLAPELKAECAGFGVVEELRIWEASEQELQVVAARDQVRIFVKFASLEGAEKAQKSLNQRYFAQRKVEASFYDAELYKQQKLNP